METTARAQHTPGHWEAIGEHVFGICIVTGRDRGTCIAHCCRDDQPPGVGEANARLIASAPALLAALEDILIYHGAKLPADLRDVAEYAIRQARGDA